ncbi:MAG: hypothetical protein ACXWF8_14710 [Methylobacter sp.]
MIRIVWLFFSAVLFVSTAQAKPLTPEQVPEPLKPWIAWVLHDSPEPACPFLYNSYEQQRCNWPSELQLDLTGNKGVFEMGWAVYRDSWVELPGDKQHWPLNATVNGKTALVMDKNGVPSIKLAAGPQYRIKGEFLWNAMPDNLTITEATGLIALRVNGAAVLSPAIKDGQLWLKSGDSGLKAENAGNGLDLQVFRKITDDVPALVLTRLMLEVSGEQREVKLPSPILDGFIPLELDSPLPARLEPDGQLLVQLRPGHWQIDVLARNSKELNTLAFNGGQPGTTIWPEAEIWVFEARPQLRVVEIEQLSAVDPNQTNLPDDWKNLPAYKIGPDQTMVFKTIRRGDPEPEPNQLNLYRKLWLDFDGQGYTVNDTITGTMTRGWRLNALPQTQLGRVALNGGNQFITRAPAGKQGIEIRSGTIALDADSRVNGAVGNTSAVGWEQDFRSVRAELNLPPGWRLLAASGVDNVPDSWISRWTLLDLFLVLIGALATAKLWNRYWGGVALVTLALIWHEPGAPQFVWLNLLAAIALLKVLPPGRFLKLVGWYRNAFWLALIVTALPFMVEQVRTGLYPQLEQTRQTSQYEFAPAVSVPASMPLMSNRMQEGLAKKSLSTEEGVNFDRIDPKAKIQTGPGLPQWHWHTVQLSWNGPVDAGQQLHLWYLTPTLTMLLNFVRVMLVALLALLMFGVAEKIRFKRIESATPLLLWLTLAPVLAMSPAPADAEIPSQDVLVQLRNKLLDKQVAPDCLPSCAEIPQMDVVISDAELTITLKVHVQHPAAIPLPADYDQWFPNRILVDGKTAPAMYRENNGLWLYLPEGEHQVALSGAAPALSKFTLPLPLKPDWIDVRNTGWQAAGVRDHGDIDDQLQFIRSGRAEPHNQRELEPNALPPFVRIERSLHLGLDWRISTRIVRVSQGDAAIFLEVPLLPGESVTTAGIRVKDGKAEVNLSAQQDELAWESTLAKSEKIDVTAAQTTQWIEVLSADISPIWHVETSGIAMMHLNGAGTWLPEWHPWPDEKIALQITRPEAVEGQTLTIDNSRLSMQPGQRGREAELSFSLRSSQGTQHTLTLPEQAVLQSVAINGQNQPIRQDGRKLTLPVGPGSQTIAVNWRETGGIDTVLTTPQVDLGVASVNANLHIGLGQDRWVLFALGPKLGPAVLFWGVLIVIAIVALGLGRIPLTPLNAGQWLLLLVGLSQIPMMSAGIVITWLMLLGWRQTRQASEIRYFNALQVALGLLALISLSTLFWAVEQGLLGSPDMQIVGNQSSAYHLNWYQDRSPAVLPTATLVSVPLLVYRLLMLAWSLWLAVSLLDWLKWGWGCFASNGLWHKKPAPVKETPPEQDIEAN